MGARYHGHTVMGTCTQLWALVMMGVNRPRKCKHPATAHAPVARPCRIPRATP